MATDTDILARTAPRRQVTSPAPTGSRMHALYVVPTLIFNFAIILIPALLTIALAFCSWDGISPPQFVESGVDNRKFKMRVDLRISMTRKMLAARPDAVSLHLLGKFQCLGDHPFGGSVERPPPDHRIFRIAVDIEDGRKAKIDAERSKFDAHGCTDRSGVCSPRPRITVSGNRRRRPADAAAFVIDSDEQTVPSCLVTDGTDQFGMIGEPRLVGQIVTKIAFIENDARRAKVAKQRAVRRVKRGRRTQTDDEMIAYTCEVCAGHELFFLRSDRGETRGGSNR